MDEDKLLLTVEESAKRLGIGRSLMYQQVLRGEIPSVMVGRCRRIANADLERFVDELRGVLPTELGKPQKNMSEI